MVDEKTKKVKSALNSLITEAIKESKSELENKQNYINISKKSIEELKNLESKKQNIPFLIETILSILVILISIGGSWFNSKIKTNKFFNDLTYLTQNVKVIEQNLKDLEVKEIQDNMNYRLLQQRLKIVIEDLKNKNE